MMLIAMVSEKTIKTLESVTYNGNRTEWSPIRSVIRLKETDAHTEKIIASTRLTHNLNLPSLSYVSLLME